MINIKKLLPQIVISALCLVSLLLSVFLFVSGHDTHRRQFVFPSADSGKYIVEYRNLAKNPVQGDVHLYVDEILLGSSVERTKLLFSQGTRVLSCFQRDSVLYLNLSDDLLEMGEGVIVIKEGFDLLEKNIKKNFPKIKDIEFFVEGKSAFEI